METLHMWEDYDKLCILVDSILGQIYEKELITRETIDNVSTDIVMGIIESCKEDNTITYDYVKLYIVNHFNTTMQNSTMEMVALAEAKNALFMTSVMMVLGYDSVNMAEILNQPIEEIDYAIDIIKTNKIVE